MKISAAALLLAIVMCTYQNRYTSHAFTNSLRINKKSDVIPGARLNAQRLHAPTNTALYKSQSNFDEGGANDNDEDEDDEDDYINDEDLPNPSNFEYRDISFGPGRGRSAPSQRKAMGKSKSGSATVYVCTNCSAEYVQWVGKCSTCNEWNTVQEFRAPRTKSSGGVTVGSSGIGGGAKSRPVFQSDSGDKPMSWLTGIDSDNAGMNVYEPVSITDVYKKMGYNDMNGKDQSDIDAERLLRERRIQIPFDEELNNVLGGGIMPGSLTLLGGDPGIGKSTLLLQMAGNVASLSMKPRKIGHGREEKGGLGPVLYVSGEENSMQIASRAMRLGIEESELLLLCETDADFIAETVVKYCNDAQFRKWDGDSENEDDQLGILGRRRQPSLVIIDSIQTMLCDNGGSSSAGGVTQVRECVGLFLRLAKSTGVPVILVGHVTKAGGVAGPRTVEHMVDAVLYLEGTEFGSSGGPNLRMLRASKNRFGSSEEVGVYSSSSTRGGRLIPVSDPSSFFLANRMDTADMEGCAISLVLEGIRPMTVEVQALVAPAGAPSFVGRRTVEGISMSRLQLIIAVLQKRCGIYLGRQDVFINVVGGISLDKSKQDGTSSDLSIAAALVSSLYNIPIRADTAFVGEIGLLGELRQVASLEKRVNEARRMGFSSVIIPKQMIERKGYKSIQASTRGIDCIEASTLLDAIEKGLTSKIPKKKAKKNRFKGSRGSKSSPPLYGDETELIIDDDDDDDDSGNNFDDDDFNFQ